MPNDVPFFNYDRAIEDDDSCTDCLEIAREIADSGAEHLIASLANFGIQARVFRDEEDRYYLYVADTCLAVADLGHPVDSIDELYGRTVAMFASDPILA